MFSTLRTRFGIPGVISVVALVFAMFGGAYAASNSSGGGKATASKAKAKRGPAGPKGATGPVGPAGPQGPAGPAGAKGDAGAAGANGAAGTGASTVAFSGSQHGCSEGGLEVKTAGGSAFVCNGEEGPQGVQGAQGTQGAPGAQGTPGSPWVVGAAPDKVILKGTWSLPQYTAAAAEEEIPVSISSGVPIPSTASSFISAAIGGGLDNGGAEGQATTVCPGSATEPTINSALLEGANVGGLCVYAAAQTNLAPPTPGGPGPATFALTESGGGVITQFKALAAGPAKGYGSWVLFTP